MWTATIDGRVLLVRPDGSRVDARGAITGEFGPSARQVFKCWHNSRGWIRGTDVSGDPVVSGSIQTLSPKPR